MFQLKTNSGITFTPLCVFGSNRKYGQMENQLQFDRKITHFSYKTNSAFILPLNELQDSQRESEREKERESLSTSTPIKPKSPLTSAKLKPAQPTFDHASPLPKSCIGQTPKTHKHWSTQISVHPSLITDPPFRSLAMHRRAPILTTDCRQCSTRLSKDRKSTRLNSSHDELSRMPSSA